MTAQGEDILAYLDAAIATRENAARAVGYDAIETGDYLWDAKYLVLRRGDVSKAAPEMDGSLADHIALNDPASVLRRCAADRKLIALHAVVPDHGRFTEGECPPDCDGEHTVPPVCFSCRTYAGDPVQSPCATLRVVAEGYGWTEGER